MKIMFLCAHPDDLELCVGEFIYQLNKIHDVWIVSATRGEWGTVNKKLKGKWLAKIRENELKAAALVNGVPPHKVKFLGYIDGEIEFKEPIIMNIINFIEKNNFDIIFAPEYFFTYYFHSDHTNLGKIILYYAYINKNKSKKNVFYYHSVYNNVFIRVDMRRTHKAIMKHKTQILLIGFFIALRPILNLLNGLISKKLPFAEGVRKLDLNTEKNLKLPLFYRILYHFYEIGKSFERPWKKETKN
ncbi:MAG: PIG-L deacetylase family protein [Candidatus Helarchaeota archaeon]